MTEPTARTPTRSTIRALLLYAIAAAGVVIASGALLCVVFPASANRHAITISAALAFVTQITTFALAAHAVRQPQRPILVAWALGMVLRLGVLIAYGALLVIAGLLPLVPALVSLVVFLFLSTLLEPLLLKGDTGVAPPSRH